MRLPSARSWGTTPAEEDAGYRCAALVGEPALVRAVTVQAPPDLTWRWVEQLQEAPYSYDLVDNLGRRSPDTLTTDLGHFEVGRPLLTMFVVAEVGHHEVTLERRPGVLERVGPVAMTYLVTPHARGSRLVGALSSTAGAGPGRGSRLVGAALAWGDLVMMRKQLLTLQAYAERDATAAGSAGA